MTPRRADGRSAFSSIRHAWFGLTEPVSRGVYAATGFGLMLSKYGHDAFAVYRASGVVWTPLDYLNPVFALRTEGVAEQGG